MSGDKTTVYDFSAELLDGRAIGLAAWRGKALLIVNTASQCGFTPQYAGLEKLHDQYIERGFEVLGFPCNQFGHQEPGTAEEIRLFCAGNYGVSFPMFAKIDVNGPLAHPLWQFLKKRKPGIFGTERIKWNFTKFLVDREGNAVRRYATRVKPEKIAPEIERLLADGPTERHGI